MAQATEGSLVLTPNERMEEPEQSVDLSLVVTDSREVSVGSTYVARIGENSDGHDFARSAVERGASLLIVERELPEIPVAQIVVDEATFALGRLAKAHLADLRRSADIKVIGITGSAGKTTTKDLLGRVLSGFGPSVWPKLSFNNEVGCPMTILQANEATRYLVLEMGASARGELRYLTNIAPLDIGVVLMVGRAHLGGFGGVQGLAEAKAELVEGILPSGTAVLNLDDDRVVPMSSVAPGHICWFSAKGIARADVRAENIEFDEAGRASFDVSTDSFTSRLQLGLVGRHQVSNALAAISAAHVLELGLDRVTSLISGLEAGSPHRMDVRALDIPLEGQNCSVRLIDDSYNANPDSMKAAFQTARQLAGNGRLFMVLGEMLELGSDSDEIHREVGEAALSVSPAGLVLIGPAKAYVPDATPGVLVMRAEDSDQAADLLRRRLRSGDTILVKGSNGSRSWKVADELVQMNEFSSKAEMA
ncbi:UDP-N-acetylmuramoyl-tripeptide--D-alanyl-D-alanine ligase [Actinomycetaceae bacterium MB13-C1-2]|nr:UDP-N-acetylmuramoyl-tripeptide--D-alanyl-D-alanine ligase [Actinomycetaceae bacterium MB13-C1-2]